MLLSSCIFQLLDMHLTIETIEMVEQQLKRFVCDFQQLYGEENMFFNVHLLTHLAECAKNFGSLWNSSLYPYENGNGTILRYRTGNNHPVIQISKKYILNRICHETYLLDNDVVKSWHSKLWNPKQTAKLQFDESSLFELTNELIIDENVHERIFSIHSKFRCAILY